MSTHEQLLGVWKTAPEDIRSLQEFGDVLLVFGADGTLTYTVRLATKKQVMLLTYRIEGDVLVTNQASAPREDRARVSFDADGNLQIHSDDRRAISKYLRVPENERPS